MKYIVILGDGMADEPVDELGGKTPLEVANKPAIDYLTVHGELGMVKTVPEGIPPGSDAANLSVMGYSPKAY
ncbi:MAG: phosphoglycerate mutase, partial [Tannerella sp.]|nr:phosphoglycerate mutase [Tannerella sp.]